MVASSDIDAWKLETRADPRAPRDDDDRRSRSRRLPDREDPPAPRVCVVSTCSREARPPYLACLQCQRAFEELTRLKVQPTGALNAGQSDAAFERACQLAGETCSGFSQSITSS